MDTLSGEATLPFSFLPYQLLKERICSYRSKFFALKVDPILEGLSQPKVNWKSQNLFPFVKITEKKPQKTWRCT